MKSLHCLALLVLLLVPSIANAGAVAAGTRFRVLGFGENDPLAADSSMIGVECVATGEGLTRYAGLPFHYGMAKCGPEGKSVDLLAAKIELLGTKTKTPVAKVIPTAKPVATKKPVVGTTVKPLSNPTPIAPGTKFRIVEFGENDPLLAADPPMVGAECVADGFLLRYQSVPFHYGQAKCGPDGASVDLLAAKIEVIEVPTPIPVPTVAP